MGHDLNISELENMHIHKTGALIRASVLLGAMSNPEAESDILDKLDIYAKHIGLAFQIRDDILDIEGDTKILGKTQGADVALNKPTYPALLGMSEAKKLAKELHDSAIDSLKSLDQRADQLRWISEYVVNRIS